MIHEYVSVPLGTTGVAPASVRPLSPETEQRVQSFFEALSSRIQCRTFPNNVSALGLGFSALLGAGVLYWAAKYFAPDERARWAGLGAAGSVGLHLAQAITHRCP